MKNSVSGNSKPVQKGAKSTRAKLAALRKRGRQKIHSALSDALGGDLASVFNIVVEPIDLSEIVRVKNQIKKERALRKKAASGTLR